VKKRKKKPTQSDVKKRMEEMRVSTPWAPLSEFTPIQRMAQLDEYAKIQRRRTRATKRK